MTNEADLSATLRALRAKLVLTQEQLAERLGVSFATVNRWEGGASKPQRAQAEATTASAAAPTEYCACDLQELLGYAQWRRFEEVIERAKTACANAGQAVGSGTTREISDLALTRYACYLIAQNGDPRKDAIAFAMTC